MPGVAAARRSLRRGCPGRTPQRPGGTCAGKARDEWSSSDRRRGRADFPLRLVLTRGLARGDFASGTFSHGPKRKPFRIGHGGIGPGRNVGACAGKPVVGSGEDLWCHTCHEPAPVRGGGAACHITGVTRRAVACNSATSFRNDSVFSPSGDGNRRAACGAFHAQTGPGPCRAIRSAGRRSRSTRCRCAKSNPPSLTPSNAGRDNRRPPHRAARRTDVGAPHPCHTGHSNSRPSRAPAVGPFGPAPACAPGTSGEFMQTITTLQIKSSVTVLPDESIAPPPRAPRGREFLSAVARVVESGRRRRAIAAHLRKSSRTNDGTRARNPSTTAIACSICAGL